MAPGVGYGVAYAHELGWAIQFGIPIGLITTQLADVLAATAFLFALTLSVSLLVFFYGLIRPSVPITPVEALVVGGFTPLALLVLLVTAGDPDQAAGPWIASGLLIIVLIAAATFRIGVFRDRLVRDPLGSWDSVRLLTNRGRSFWIPLGIAVVVGLLVFAYTFGGEQARNQAVFLVTDSAKTPELDLAIYGDIMVLAPFDQSKHLVLPEFDIIKIGATSLHLRYRNVGPFKTDKKLIVGAA